MYEHKSVAIKYSEMLTSYNQYRIWLRNHGHSHIVHVGYVWRGPGEGDGWTVERGT